MIPKGDQGKVAKDREHLNWALKPRERSNQYRHEGRDLEAEGMPCRSTEVWEAG